VRDIGVLLLLIGLALMGLGLLPSHESSSTSSPGSSCSLADSRNVTLSFAPGYTWSIDVAVGSPPSIVSIEAVRYEVGPYPMGASGLQVIVYIDDSMVYNGTAGLGSDGLYHAIVPVDSSYVDGRSHSIHVELYACEGEGDG
jgi:hypothetical protein